MSRAAKERQFIIGDYEVLSELGRGYDAVVYLAKKNECQYAIKVPHQRNINDSSQDHLERFRREAYTLARLSHPAVPKVIEIGESEGVPFLAMEFVHGITLTEKLNSDYTFSDSMVTWVGITIAGALSELHRHQIVHRDIKSDNMMLSEDGSVRLIDLGMAGDPDTVKRDDHKHRVLGTLQYSAPEQTGILKRRVDARSDLYSLGVTLYQLITRQLPFNSADVTELLQMSATLTPTPPHQIRSDVSLILSNIVMKLIQKDPDDRYQSAKGLIWDLENIETLQVRLSESGKINLGTKDFSGNQSQLALEGRDQEVAILRQKIASTINGRGGSLMIEAESGMGKSRLAREMVSLALDSGFVVLQAKCNDKGSSVPLGVIREALDSILRWSEHLQESEQDTFWKSIRHSAKGLEASLYRTCSAKLIKTLFGVEAESNKNYDIGLDQLLAQLIEFFTHLGTKDLCFFFYIDDIQWADDLSLRFLTDLSIQAKDLKLQVLLTIRKENKVDFTGTRSGGSLYLANQKSLLQLEPMSESGVLGFLKNILGEKAVQDAVLKRIAKSSGGNPFLIQEITFAFLNRGDLTLEQDTWTLKESSLSSVDFSTDVYRLILGRAVNLPEEYIRIITEAAIVGNTFPSDILSKMTSKGDEEIQIALDAFQKINFIEFDHDSKLFSFSHDKIREALLKAVPQEKLQKSYGQLAELFDRDDEVDPNKIFSVAQYYRLSEWKLKAGRAFGVNLRAGVLLLESYAFGASEEVLAIARQMIELAQPEQKDLYQLHVSLGTAFTNLGKHDEAFESFAQARVFARGRLNQAKIQLLECRTLSATGRNWDAWNKMKECLQTLGFGFANHKLHLIFKTLCYLLMSLAYRLYPFQLGILKNPSRKKEAQKYEFAAQALEVGMYLAYFFGDPLSFAYISFRNYLFSNKLGDSKELVKAHCSVALLWALFVIKPFMNWHLKMAEEMVQRLKDSHLQAFWLLQRNWCAEFSGSTIEAEVMSRETLSYVEKYAGSWVYSQMLTDLGGQYLNRGMVREGVNFLVNRLPEIDRTQSLSLMANARGYLYYASTVVGGVADSNKYHSEWLELLQKLPSNKFSQAALPGDTILALADTEDYGEKFEKAVQDFYNFKVEDHHFKIPYCMIAHARLKQYETAKTPEQKKEARKKLSKAILDLTFRATIPLWKSHLYIVRAGRLRVDNKLKKVSALLEKAETYALEAGCESAKYLAAREWARYQRALGNKEKMLKEAWYALELAINLSYANRIKQISKEFSLEAEAAPKTSNSMSMTSQGLSSYHSGQQSIGFTDRRILNSLLQVSIASTATLEPAGQIQYVLDEIIKVFGAERGFVFVWEEQVQKLVFKGGRNSTSQNLDEPKGHSDTVVRTVCEKRTPLIVTSLDELEELGSKSAMINDLRSIICVPLFLKESFKGVLYIDSHLARGLFNSEDLNALMAIANHIGIALEHSRMSLVEAEKREMAKELVVSAAVQSMLLPEKESLFNDKLHLVSYYKPAVQCGGDWWWYKESNEQISIFVGDVTGHGAGSAMVTACIASAFKIYESQMVDSDFGSMLSKVNEEFISFAKGEYLMTGVIIQYNFKSKKLNWWGAGSPLFIVLRPKEKPQYVGNSSTPLGLSPFKTSSGEIQMQSGDRMIVFTDGIPEMATVNGLLGERRFLKMLEVAMAYPLEAFPKFLSESLEKLSSEPNQQDDYTLVAVEIK